MGIFRGEGGTGDSNTDATVTAVTEQATIATTKASEAAASAAEASTSAANSAASASSSSNSSAAAATSATQAATSATASAASATASASSATSAATAQANAETAEANAETAETNAAASATTATTKAAEAATSATSASNSASTATTKASEAATSASNAATSETNAATSASTATTKASEASTSASNAATSEANAAASYDDFDDRYLGAKSSAPSTDNDGDALVTGALYFDTSVNAMKVYSGSAWLDAYVSLSGALIATNNLSDLNNAGTARTNLGLGTAATTASTDYATAAQGTTADNALPKSGGAMTGAITTNSTFDGRNVSADGTKLDGIEAGATADQTAAEIKTAYESNADTNAFTDADHTKLDGIEASADVTDTTNVVAALSAGTGISLSVGGVIANTSPDQTVSLTGAGTTTVSGTYPNFTITGAGTTYTAGTGITLTGTEFSLTDASDYMKEFGSTTADLDTLTASGAYRIQNSNANRPADWGQMLTVHGGLDTIGQIYFDYSDGNIFTRAGNPSDVGGSGSWSAWRTVWTNENDGSGSGLDADTVDGIQASSFLRSDTNDSISAGTTYTFGTSDTEGFRFTNSSYNKSLYIGGWSSSNSAGISRIRNSNDNLHLDSGANGNLYLNHYSSGTIYANGGTVWHSNNDGSGSGLDADTVDGVHASSFNRFYNNSYLNSSTTTANLIAELQNDYGAFNNNSVTLKNAWSYAGNSNLVTGHPTLGTIELAGCLVEAWGGTYKHIRITRPTTGTGGQKIAIYNDQGGSYSPGWREVWNSETAGIVPSGGIIMWSGSTSSIPSGYVLCNGSNGTPDLRDRFIVGAGSSYSVGNTGGASSVTLSTSNLPSHTHSFSATTSTKSLTGSFQFTDNNSTYMKIRARTASGIASTSYSGSASHVNSSGVPSSANLPNAINLNASHNHTLSGTTGSSGSGSSHENRPPYYALAYIMKT